MALRRRFTVLFFSLVLVPVAAVSALAWKVARDARAVAQTELEALFRGRLQDVRNGVVQTVGEVERHLLTGLENTPPNDQALRALRRREPLAREVFVLDAAGQLRFPPDSASATPSERAFRTRTALIWRGEVPIYAPPHPEGSGRSTPMLKKLGRSQPTIRGERGWIFWHWDEGLHLLFWARASDGGAIGVEVDRIVLLSRLVARLARSGDEQGLIRLVDSRGDPVHVLGDFEPPGGASPSVRLALAHPLDSYALHYFASPGQRRLLAASSSNLTVGLGVLALALSLLAIAYYVHREYRGRLQEAAQRVSFVTQVSHELRTPLTNIRLYAELMEETLDEDDEEASGRLRVIVSESQRLGRLIGNILTFSRSTRGKLEVHRERVVVDEVVESVVAQFSPALGASGVAAELSLQAPQPVLADRDALGQILANLVSNVEKYAASGGHLRIISRQEGKRTFVYVSDWGPGISDMHRGQIFRPFYRVSDRLVDGVTGTGIGLTISRELAEKNGGQLELVDSDEGACFRLTLETDEEQTT